MIYKGMILENEFCSMPAVTQHSPERTRVLNIALIEAAKRLDLGSTELQYILGISQPTASRLLRGAFSLAEGSKPWELGAHLVRLYRSLSSMVGGNDELARAWLHSNNRWFDDQQPAAQLRRIDGLLHVCEYLDAQRARV